MNVPGSRRGGERKEICMHVKAECFLMTMMVIHKSDGTIMITITALNKLRIQEYEIITKKQN